MYLIRHQDCLKVKPTSKDEKMHLDVGKMKAALKYRTPLHLCSHGYLRTLSNSKKKAKFDVCYMARLVCRGATHLPNQA